MALEVRLGIVIRIHCPEIMNINTKVLMKSDQKSKISFYGNVGKTDRWHHYITVLKKGTHTLCDSVMSLCISITITNSVSVQYLFTKLYQSTQINLNWNFS